MLKPCPCGAVPDNLEIEGCGKWGWVSGGCCGEWAIEFRLQYADPTGPEAYRAACVAWDDAPRDAALTARAEKAERERDHAVETLRVQEEWLRPKIGEPMQKLGNFLVDELEERGWGFAEPLLHAAIAQVRDLEAERDEARAKIAAAGNILHNDWRAGRVYDDEKPQDNTRFYAAMTDALSDSPALAATMAVMVARATTGGFDHKEEIWIEALGVSPFGEMAIGEEYLVVVLPARKDG